MNLATLTLGLLLSFQTPTVDQVIKGMRKAFADAKGISFTLEDKSEAKNPNDLKVKALRPNYYWAEGKYQSFYSDGGTVLQYFPDKNEFNKAPDFFLQGLMFTNAFALYTGPEKYKSGWQSVTAEEFEGEPVYTLKVRPAQMSSVEISMMVDAKTFLPVAERQTGNSPSLRIVRDLKLDHDFKPQDFAWTPPAGAKDMDAAARPSMFLAIGSVAPNFELTLPDGSKTDLDKLRREKKAVLLNFWFYGCGYCMKEMPELQKLYSKLKDQGLEVVAISPRDTAETILKYKKQESLTFPFAIDKDGATGATAVFGASKAGFPTNYIIDGSGKVAYADSGYGHTGFQAMLAKLAELGFKL